MQHDWSLPYLDRIARAAETTAETSARSRREIAKLRHQVEELVWWVKRLALAAALWGSGIGMTLTSDQIAEVIVAMLKGGR